jgi:hypothetical protein
MPLRGLFARLFRRLLRHHVQDQRVRLDLQDDARGQLQVAGVDRLTHLHALHVDVDALRDVRGLGLHRDLDDLLVEHPAGEDLTDQPDRHVDGDLLAAADQDQVDVLDDVLDRIPLHRLRQGDLAAVLQALEAQQHVRRPQGPHQVMPGQAQMAGLRAVSVQHGGHPAFAADTAGSALAELVTSLGGDLYLGHGALLISTCNARTKCSRQRRRVRMRSFRRSGRGTRRPSAARPVTDPPGPASAAQAGPPSSPGPSTIPLSRPDRRLPRRTTPPPSPISLRQKAFPNLSRAASPAQRGCNDPQQRYRPERPIHPGL